MHKEITQYGKELEKLEEDIALRDRLPMDAKSELSKLREQYRQARRIWEEYENADPNPDEELKLKALGAIAALRDAYHRTLAHL